MLVAPVPALATGVMVMRGGGVPPAMGLLNVAAAGAGIALTAFAMALTRPVHRSADAIPWGLVLAVALLGASLLASGTQGVHRWLPLGPVRLHVGALLLPPVLALLWKARWAPASAVGLVILGVLMLQPDAAQASSFCAAWIAIVVLRREKGSGAVVVLSLLITLVCLLRPDPLDAVPYVEGIIGMAAAQGPLPTAASLISLAMLPLSLAFLLDRPVGGVLALYVAGTLCAAGLGNYPVPVLGYGVSPILGYYGAIAAYAVVGRAEAGAPQGAAPAPGTRTPPGS